MRMIRKDRKKYEKLIKNFEKKTEKTIKSNFTSVTFKSLSQSQSSYLLFF